MINQKQLRELVIRPMLQYLDPRIPYSETAVELLMMTQAHESNGGYFLKQEKGPALGIYQMEPATFDDLWDNFIKYDHNLYVLMAGLEGNMALTPGEQLVHDIGYATAMARVHYFRDSEPLPTGDLSDERTIWELAMYAKRVWNTEAGKATVQDYYDKYMKYCLPI